MVSKGRINSPHDLLLPYQADWVNDHARFKCGCWSRQTGKDFSTTNEVVRHAMSEDKTTWMIAAPSERQSLETLDKCKDWISAYQITIDDLIEERNGYQALLNRATIYLPNGSRILAVPGKPDTVRGMSANTCLTEFAFFEDPDGTWRAIFPSITNPLRGGKKLMRVYSTPNGKSGPGRRFYKMVLDNLLEPKKGRKFEWSVHMVNIEDAVRRGLPVDIEELRAGMDDAEGWQQEMMCQFLDTANVLLPYDLIALAESGEATEFGNPTDVASGAEIYCGIDFGRTNDPTVCWTLEKIGDVLWTREVLVLDDMSTPDQEQLLNTRLAVATRVCLDYTGPGIGLGDYLARNWGEFKPSGHDFGRVELCTFTAQFKREIFPRLRRQFEAPTNLRIPISVEIREDLHEMQQVVRNGQYSYVAKRTQEGHSDRCTALALAVRAASFPGAVLPPRRFGRLGTQAGRAANARRGRRNRSSVGL